MRHSSLRRRRQTLLSWLAVVLIVLLQVQLLPTMSVIDSDVIASSAKQSQDKTIIQANYGKLPLAFEPNQGQTNEAVSYLVHHGQATTYFNGTDTTTTVGDGSITMSLDNASKSSFTGTNQLESKTNYFIGNDESKWHADIPNYQQLLAKNVYPGIDLKYYGTNSTLEHDFIVSPNTDYQQIAFHFTGQDNLTLDDNGNLILKTANDKDTVTLNAPITYQQTKNSKHTIPSKFNLDPNNNTVTIALNAEYDKSQPLIIDPALEYSTYLGGSGSETGYSVGVGVDGSAYLFGTTLSSNFPSVSPYDGSLGGVSDVFVAKFNPTGSSLVYSTFIGGSGGEEARDITVDSSGNVYVTGDLTSTDFPTVSPMQAANGGTSDVFIAKLNAAGSALTYSTYLGGSGIDVGDDIAIDNSDSAYITGSTRSTNFPVTSPMQATHGGGIDDAFVAKLDTAGSARMYSTYLGGNGADIGMGIAVDSSGNAYIVGSTASTNFPMTSPMQGSNGGSGDAFVTKLNAAGSARTYSTYLGGSGGDEARGIAIDSSNNVYIAGSTASTNFPTTTPIQIANAGGASDAFVTKLNAISLVRTYSTYLGGAGSDIGRGLVVDNNGNAFVAGNTTSTNFPIISPTQATNGGGTDGFLTEVNTTGTSWSFSSYLGGSGSDIPTGIAIDVTGNAYVSGQTLSTNFPTFGAFQSSNGGGQDAMLVKFQFVTPISGDNIAALSTSAVNATGVTFSLTASGQTSALTKCIQVAFTTTKGATVKPTDMSIASAALAGTSAFMPTPATWSLSANNSTGVITLTNVAGEVTSGGNGKTLIFNNMTNGSVPNTTYYDEITSFSDVGCTTQIDQFDPAFVFVDPVILTAQVNPVLTFTVGSTSCALGALSVSETKQCTYVLTASTNGTTGYTISYIPVVTLTSGANTITDLAAQTASTLNAEQFGINLRANTAVGSHTASAFGADVSGGSGLVASAYNTSNSFKLVTAGDIIASTPAPSLTSTYTISTIANITNATEAGAYLTVLTYNIVAGY